MPFFHGSFLVVLDEMAQLLGLIYFTPSGSILRKIKAFKSLFKAVKTAEESVYLSVLVIHPHSSDLDSSVVIVVPSQHSHSLCILD
jgi:fructoselysine-6-P-deglycase FrlB-like protein